jgi:hypothetical protein
MSVPTLERPPDRVAVPRRRLLLLWLLVGTALVSLGVAVAVLRRPAPGATPAVPAHARPALLPPGPNAEPITVTGPDGRAISCPVGSEPSVYLTYGSFTPPLTGGTVMAKGRYHIHMRGSVNNETGAAVDIRLLTAAVRGRFWPQAKITVPRSIKPQSSVPIEIDGDYHSTESGSVNVATHLDWRWHSADLAACGAAGLVEDD